MQKFKSTSKEGFCTDEVEDVGYGWLDVVLELAGNLLAELLAEISSALLAEIFLLLAEKSRNFEPFLMIFTQILKKYHQKIFFFRKKITLN